MAGHYDPEQGWVEDDQGDAPSPPDQPPAQYQPDPGSDPSPPMQGGGGDWGDVTPSSMVQPGTNDYHYQQAFPNEYQYQPQGSNQFDEAGGRPEVYQPTESHPWDPKMLEERRSQPGWDDQTGGGLRSQQRKPDLMYFTNPQTGRGGVVELPAGRDGEKLQWDYQQRGFQTSVNQRPGQQQQQQGGRGPATIEEQLGNVRLTPEEGLEIGRLNKAIGVARATPMNERDRRKYIADATAQLAPLLRRQQMTDSLMKQQQMQQKTEAHAQDFAVMTQRAKAWKEMFDKGDLSVDVKDKDGNTVAVMAMGPDGKTMHFPAAKPADTMKQDDATIKAQQSQEKHVIDMEMKKKALEERDRPKDPKLSEWQERARGDLAREGNNPLKVVTGKDGVEKTVPDPAFEKLVHQRAGEYMADHRKMREQQQKEREQKTQGFTQAPLPSNQQTAPQGPPQPQQGPPPVQAAPVPPPAPEVVQKNVADFTAKADKLAQEEPQRMKPIIDAYRAVAELAAKYQGNAQAAPPDVQKQWRQYVETIKNHQLQQR